MNATASATGEESAAPTSQLAVGDKFSLPIKVVTTAKATKSQIICSRIVMADGTMVDPSTSFKAAD